MKSIIPFCLIISFLIGCNRENDERLIYNLKYQADPNPYFLVQLSFRGSNSGTTVLKIPHEWAWQKTYEKGIKDVQLISDGKIMHAENNIDYVINHPEGSKVRIRYKVQPYWDDPITDAVYYRPILRGEYFYFIGYGVFAVPDWKTEKKVEVKLIWDDIPPDWRMATSFGVEQNSQKFTAKIEQFLHAAYMAGDFSIKEMDVFNSPVNIAIRGNWNFTYDDFYSTTHEVVSAVRSFWDDYDFPQFLISMIPTENEGSRGGTGLSNSFSLFVSPDFEKATALQSLLVHELFHTWNGRKIQREEPEELVYWFSEGFTNYYTRQILYRQGMISRKEMIDDFNHTIKEYYTSSAVNYCNDTILTHPERNRDIINIPYLRGDIFATLINFSLEENTRINLDYIMLNLLHKAESEGMKISTDRLKDEFEIFLPGKAKELIEKYIVRGETIILDKHVLGTDIEVHQKVTHRFDLGFDWKNSKQNDSWVITSVEKDGPAWNAGIRPGFRIVGKSIHWNQIDKPVILIYKDEKGDKRKTSYLPFGAKVVYPEYILTESNTGESIDQFLAYLKSPIPSPL